MTPFDISSQAHSYTRHERHERCGKKWGSNCKSSMSNWIRGKRDGENNCRFVKKTATTEAGKCRKCQRNLSGKIWTISSWIGFWGLTQCDCTQGFHIAATHSVDLPPKETIPNRRLGANDFQMRRCWKRNDFVDNARLRQVINVKGSWERSLLVTRMLLND